MRIGVAISTTGDDHRMGFLETCVQAWRRALPLGAVIVVTVDGTRRDAEKVREIVDRTEGGHVGGNTWRVGQRAGSVTPFDGHLGVAVNKNTGIELLMASGVEHLFLCDDDTWPLSPYALTKHIELAPKVPHSMVCWGGHRLVESRVGYATWSWPRGSLLYATRRVIDTVGGMVEDFGPGGHEHVEWSRRIHEAGLTPAPYCSPAVYAEMGTTGRATRASALWNAEDMRKPREPFAALRQRRAKITSVRRTPDDWPHIESLMAAMEGNADFVPYHAYENGRASATLCSTSTGLGAGGEK